MGAGTDRIVAAARAAFAHDFILQLPMQYDTIVGNAASGFREERNNVFDRTRNPEERPDPDPRRGHLRPRSESENSCRKRWPT